MSEHQSTTVVPLTIVVPAYNAAAYLDKCVRSMVASNALPQLDIIIVNDGSTDETSTIAERYNDRYPDSVRVITKENGGHGSTINEALRWARGKYFKVVDSDDWVSPSGLAALLGLLGSVDADVVLSPYLRHFSDSGIEELVALPGGSQSTTVLTKSFAECGFRRPLHMHELCYKTAILRDIDLTLDEHAFYVDQEYVLYPIPRLQTVAAQQTPVTVYRLGTQEQSVNRRNVVKNCEQHRRVVFSCVEHFLRVLSDLAPAQRQYMEMHLGRLISTQFHIYLLMPPNQETRDRMRQFYVEITELTGDTLRPKYDPLVGSLIASGFRLSQLAAFANSLRLGALGTGQRFRNAVSRVRRG